MRIQKGLVQKKYLTKAKRPSPTRKGNILIEIFLEKVPKDQQEGRYSFSTMLCVNITPMSVQQSKL